MSDLSSAEELLAVLLGDWFPAHPFEREYRFAPPRRWRFDFAWPEAKVAVEVEGVRFGRGGRHQHPTGFLGDAEKHEAALVGGWRLYRIPAPWITWRGRMRLEDVRLTLENLLRSGA